MFKIKIYALNVVVVSHKQKVVYFVKIAVGQNAIKERSKIMTKQELQKNMVMKKYL